MMYGLKSYGVSKINYEKLQKRKVLWDSVRYFFKENWFN